MVISFVCIYLKLGFSVIQRMVDSNILYNFSLIRSHEVNELDRRTTIYIYNIKIYNICSGPCGAVAQRLAVNTTAVNSFTISNVFKLFSFPQTYNRKLSRNWGTECITVGLAVSWNSIFYIFYMGISVMIFCLRFNLMLYTIWHAIKYCL